MKVKIVKNRPYNERGWWYDRPALIGAILDTYVKETWADTRYYLENTPHNRKVIMELRKTSDPKFIISHCFIAKNDVILLDMVDNASAVNLLRKESPL